MLEQSYSDAIWHRINQKTKPLGALGQLESVAHQLALIASHNRGDVATQLSLKKPSVWVFAGDHGIAQEGVSIAPSAVTRQMVLNFLNGGAAINCFARVNDIELNVVDTGIIEPIDNPHPNLIVQRLGAGTDNFSLQPAMSREQVNQGIEYGRQMIVDAVKNGSDMVMFGEMGIGNTSSASAIFAALSLDNVTECVGRGTGITPEQLEKKIEVVAKGVVRCQGQPVLDVLAEVGGFEIVQMVGAFLGAHQSRVPVVVDGFITSVAAYCATLIAPDCREYMIFAHQSQEQGHKRVLELMNAEPLLDLSLRLGEGTGAALAVPLIKGAIEFYNHMASFEDAGVTV